MMVMPSAEGFAVAALSVAALSFMHDACTEGVATSRAVRFESASAAYPLSKRIIEHAIQHERLKVVLGDAGTVEALRRLCSGETDLASVARPMQKGELARCDSAKARFVEIPIALDAIAVVVNRRNTFVSHLSVEALAAIWAAESQAKVTRWSQVDSTYPELPLKLYGLDGRGERGNYFFEAVLGRGREARGDVTASVDDDLIVEGVARDVNGLGYVPLGYYLRNRGRLRAVPIARTSVDASIVPSTEAIAKGLYQPLTRPLFLYVNARALERQEVRWLAQRYTTLARRAADELSYVPLAEETYERAAERLRKGVTGSQWGGVVPVGLTLEAIHERSGLR